MLERYVKNAEFEAACQQRRPGRAGLGSKAARRPGGDRLTGLQAPGAPCLLCVELIQALRPEDDWEGFLQEHARHSEGLAHPVAVRQVVATAARLLTDLAAIGAPLERDASGHLVRGRLPVAGRRYVPRLGFDSIGLARRLRQLAIRAGARCLD